MRTRIAFDLVTTQGIATFRRFIERAADLVVSYGGSFSGEHGDGCHQHAIMGYDADQALLRAAGIDLDVLDAGCCGLAGNFGFEAGHYDVSRACGERVLLPAARDAATDTLVLADGFSCRTQIEQGGTGRTPVHLAEILAAGLPVVR